MNRVTPGKIILGELGEIEAGVRQLIRTVPLETVEILLPSGRSLRSPRKRERCESRRSSSSNGTRCAITSTLQRSRPGMALALQRANSLRSTGTTATAQRSGTPVADQLVRQLADTPSERVRGPLLGSRTTRHWTRVGTIGTRFAGN